MKKIMLNFSVVLLLILDEWFVQKYPFYFGLNIEGFLYVFRERSYLCDKKQGQLLTQGKLNTLHKIEIEFVIRNWLKMKFVTREM